jgi:hypothetical protein
MSVIVANATNNTDGTMAAVMGRVDSPIPIVLVSRADDFKFNDSLLSLSGTPYVLCDVTEYGWNVDIEKTGTHIWGENTQQFDFLQTDEWAKFDEWVASNPPLVTFKREILKRDVSDKLLPIEYPRMVETDYPVDTKEVFNARPINAFQYWGRSNENRLRIHGEIWLHAYKKGFSVCDNIYFYNDFMHNERGEKWVTLWMPHWSRVPITELLKINGFSKLSLSWPGAGFKCFRTGEAGINSTLTMHKNNYAWAYDFTEENSILVDYGKEIEGIEEALKREDLYEVYRNGIENCNKYKLSRYIKEYIEPIIKSR